VVSVVTLTSLLLIPLPSFFYNKLRHSYQLVVRRSKDAESDLVTDDAPLDTALNKELVFEVDTNLPIRLLFILNAMPLLNAKEKQIQELAYAYGSPDTLADKLMEL